MGLSLCRSALEWRRRVARGLRKYVTCQRFNCRHEHTRVTVASGWGNCNVDRNPQLLRIFLVRVPLLRLFRLVPAQTPAAKRIPNRHHGSESCPQRQFCPCVLIITFWMMTTTTTSSDHILHTHTFFFFLHAILFSSTLLVLAPLAPPAKVSARTSQRP